MLQLDGNLVIAGVGDNPHLLQLWRPNIEGWVVGEAISFCRDTKEICIEMMVAIFVMEKCNGIRAGASHGEAGMRNGRCDGKLLTRQFVFSVKEMGWLIRIDRDGDVACGGTHAGDINLQPDLCGVIGFADGLFFRLGGRLVLCQSGLPGWRKQQIQRAQGRNFENCARGVLNGVTCVVNFHAVEPVLFCRLQIFEYS